MESSDLSAQKDGVTASWPSRIGPLACCSRDFARATRNLHLMFNLNSLNLNVRSNTNPCWRVISNIVTVCNLAMIFRCPFLRLVK